MAREKKCSFCGNSEKENKLIEGDTSYVFICETCIQNAHDQLLEKSQQEKDMINIQTVKPSMIKKHLDSYVIAQDDAKETLSVAVYNHYKRLRNETDVELQKSNILMIGSTGSGKTYIAQTIAKFIGVPFAIADATSLTQAGYVGDNPENILFRLLENASYDVKKAEQGIIYIDEIDKLKRVGENTSTTRDVSGEGVQQALLKIIEGSVVDVPMGSGKFSGVECIKIDTSNILFICGGAFEGLSETTAKPEPKKAIGFNTQDIEVDIKESMNTIEPSDVIKFGMSPEFVGRLPIITTLKPLTKDDLKRILIEPKNALIKQYQALMSMDGVNLEFTESALNRIAELAIIKNTGARGLRSILEKSMQKIMYRIPDMDNLNDAKAIINEDAIDGKTNVIIKKGKNKKLAAC